MNVQNISNEKYYEQSSKLESQVQNKNVDNQFKKTLIDSNLENIEKGQNVQNQQMNLATNLAPLLQQSRLAQKQISNGYLDIKI
jgi:TATA-binding protein-associated factor Taf7